MKRFMAFILAFVMVMGSITSFAAPGDIIHTGNKKVYKPNSQELVDDIVKNDAEIEQFYREVESNDGSRKFVNIVAEEKEQFAYIEQLVKDNNLTSPEELAAYLESNKDDINTELERITNGIAKDFDLIPDGGSLDDYFGSSKAPILKIPENYSTPVPGYADGTTKIVNLTLPKGASSWIYKLDEKEFTDLGIDTILKGTTKYNSGTDIKVEAEKHLLLGAVDSAGKLKAYASIKILDNMIKKPRVELKPDLSINPTLSPAVNYSGATKVSGDLGDGSWKISVLDKLPEIVYEDSKFNEVMEYKDGMEIVVANDSELDKGLAEFKKHLIIYNEIDGKIEKYKIFDLDANNVSGILKAEPLISEKDNSTDYNYSTPVRGDSAGTTKIERLNLPKGATKWMYVTKVNANVEPNRDRVYEGSNPYEAGQSIKVSVGDYLMVLATDNGGKVRAYGIVKIDPDMIKNPLATELRETTHYTKPVKGITTGSSKFEFLKHADAKSWKYKFSDTVIDIPELGSELTGGEDLPLSGQGTGDIVIESDLNKLKEDNFRRYMMIYGLDDGGKNVLVYKNFIMNDTNVRMPDAGTLGIDAHYFGNTKGNNPNTTRFSNLATTGIPGTKLKFKYKVVDEEITNMEFNKIIEGTDDLRPNVDISVTVGKHLLILVVDEPNKTKAFTTIPLTFDNVKAGNATLLQPTTNYVGPVPGGGSNSTKFTFLNLPTGASKFVYKVGDTSFGIPESGSVVEGDLSNTEVEKDVNIEDVAANKYLLLLAVDDSNKVIAYREFRLLDNQVKGGDGTPLVDGAYELIPGDKPSTAKLKLEPLGLENPNSIIWRYKLVDSIPTENKDKPYFNEIVDGTTLYSVNSTTKIGPDISVSKAGDTYGYILILATDSSGRTKAYKYVKITSGYVKEHAPEIKDNSGSKLELIDGTDIDSVNFKNLPDPEVDNRYKYLISDTRPTTPAIDDSLPNGVVDYTKGDDITVNIGKYLSLYEVDKDNKIVKFSSIEVIKVKQGTATLVLTSPTDLVEGNIVNGGPKLTITLTGAKWADLANDKSARDKFFNGFKADSQVGEWTKVVNSMIADGKGGISIDSSKTILTILLPETPSYDIKEEQIVGLTIPFEAIENALNPIILTDTIQIKPTVGATISGDVVNSVVRQADIEAGGKTIVIDLADGAWAHDVSGIIDGFSSSGTQWSTIAGAIANGKIVRNSSSKVTITLPPVTGVDFGTTTEVISLKIDKDKKLIQGATEDVVASPKFSLYPNRIQVKGETVNDKNTITLMAPDYRIIDTTNDTWIIEVSQGKLNEPITDKDLIITGLPRGLTANVSKVSGQNQIQIKLTGTASATLSSDTLVKIKIKGTAVTEPNSVDSDEIGLKLVRGSSMMKDLEKVKVNVVDGKLLNTTFTTNSEMEYSLNSTNGTTNGVWHDADAGVSTNVTPKGGFKAGKVYVRDKNNTNVFHLVTTLVTPKTPTGVSVNNVDYTSEVGKAKVKLDLPSGVNYDYSVDGGKDWVETFISTDDITLDPDSDLRIRLRATEKELASLATVKLNGLYLGDVKLNVGSGTITGTNTSMQYSLDSTDGIDGKWATAKANETLVTLLPSHMVWIRQQTSKVNFNKLGDVVAESSPDLSTGITYNIKEKEITNGTGQSLEYKVTGGNWTKMKTKDDNNGVTEKVSFAPGSLEIRTSGTPTTLASTPLTLVNIPNPIDPPELKGNDDKKTISYLDTDNSWKEIDSTFEYKIGSSIEWKSGDTFKDDPSKTQTVVIYVRKAATDKLLPSKEKSISFTANINFANIIFDIAGKSILGTTTDMEYSISSTAENNNIWKTAGNGDTPIEPFEGMYIWLREKNKPSTETLYVEKLARQVIPDLTYVYYNIGTKKISNQSSYNLEYRINNNSWTKIDAKTDLYDIDFVPGKLEFRQRSTNEKMESNPNLKDTIKAKSSGPKVEIDDVENKVMSIISPTLDRSKLEYRVNSINDNSPWISGELLDGEDLNGNKIIEIRVKADDKTLSSQVTKVEFTKNLELGHVKLSTHVKPLELNGTTAQMEYMINDSNKWLPCIDGDTKLKRMDGTTDLNDINLINKLEIRDSKQHANTFIVYQK